MHAFRGSYSQPFASFMGLIRSGKNPASQMPYAADHNTALSP
jgi:hypothetical protein